MSWPFSDYLIIPRRRVIVPVYDRDHFFGHVYNEEEWPLGLFSSKFFNYSTVGVIILRWKNDPGHSTGVIILI